MHFGLDIVTLGEYADPRPVLELAQAAESSGWEAVFVWDHLAFAWGVPSGDPWVILAALAQATQTVKIGPAVTPLPRRRPHVLANTLATLDLLSNGRTIFGVGIGGVPVEFTAFGELDDTQQRAASLDEGLEIINKLWSGERVTHAGSQYTINSVTLSPLPVQRPRIPIWVGGESRPAMRRAARWDGWIVGGFNERGEMVKTPQHLSEQLGYLRQHRHDDHDFAVAYIGDSSPTDGELVRELADAGATWWLESIYGLRGSHQEMLTRVQTGPPQ